MRPSSSVVRVVGRSAWIAAWAGVALAPVHALSRFATEDGREDLRFAPTRLWAEPAAERLRPLLQWSDPDTVYITYGKGWLVLFVAATACAFLVHSTRRRSGLERLAWPVALTGLVLASASLVSDYFTPWIDESFLFLGIPGTLISVLGSLTLGIALLRRGFRPRATAWLLILWLPLLVVLSSLVAMGAGALPMLFAWGFAGRAMGARRHTRRPLPTPSSGASTTA
ncbi:hypothetical protein [Asanoa sp. NPDC050611]|uniref:hypothetical protein n=1 Tax=Asanoa sp. NPDC050611 TaxID=3157098 RepID=UPI00340538C5